MATKKDEKKEKAEEKKVLTVKVEPAPKETPGPTIVEQTTTTPTPAQTMSAADQEALRIANQRSVNHEPVEKTVEAITADEAEQRAASQEELNEFLANEAELDPTTKKLTKKQIDEARARAAEKTKNKVEQPPAPPAPDNDIPHA